MKKKIQFSLKYLLKYIKIVLTMFPDFGNSITTAHIMVKVTRSQMVTINEHKQHLEYSFWPLKLVFKVFFKE